MDVSLQSRFATAKESLQGWYDQLNKEWQKAEEIFASMNLAQWVEVPVRSIEDDFGETLSTRNHVLGWTCEDGSWAIRSGWCRDGDYLDTTWKRITDSSLDDRVSALTALPALLAKAVEGIEQTAAQIEVALAAARESLAPFKLAVKQ